MNTLELNYRADLALIAIEEHTTRLAIDAYFKLNMLSRTFDLYAELRSLESQAAEVHLNYEMAVWEEKQLEPVENCLDWWVASEPEPRQLTNEEWRELYASHDRELCRDTYPSMVDEFVANSPILRIMLADDDELPF